MITNSSTLLILLLGGVAFGAVIISFILLHYIRLTRIKEIDQMTYGHEFPNDNLIVLAIRTMNYGGAFIWKWSARRGGLEKVVEKFGIKYKWPFITFFILIFLSIISFAGVYFIDKYYIA